MTKRKTVSNPTPSLHTGAWWAYEKNLDAVMHVLGLVEREVSVLKPATARVTRSLSKRLATLQEQNDAKSRAASVVRLGRTVDSYSKLATTMASRIGVANLWIVVMMVTSVEAYLQDVLGAAAGVDEKLMANSEQAAIYAEVVAASSIEELAAQLRSRWAKGWVNDGGPPRWIKRLNAMGAKGYPDDLGARMDLMWGVRHVAVHAAGVATADFVRRHPGVVKGVGDHVTVSMPRLKSFTNAMAQFVSATEEHFLSRCPSLAASKP